MKVLISPSGRTARYVPAILLALVLGGGAYVIGSSQFTRGTHLDSGSSYRSAGDGTRGLYLLLEKLGLRVSRLQRGPYLTDARAQLLSIGPSPGDATPRRSRAEAAAQADFVRRGGRIVYFSRIIPADLLEALTPVSKSPERKKKKTSKLEDARSRLETLADDDLEEAPRRPIHLHDDAGRDVVVRNYVAVTTLPASARPFLWAGSRVAAFSLARGKGEFDFIGSPDPAGNREIEQGDNLDFVLSHLDRFRPVIFDEYRHGFDEDETLPGLLARYGLRLMPFQLGLLLVFLALRAASDPPAASAPPETVQQGSRIDLVSAMAALTLRTVPEPEAAEALREHFRVSLIASRFPREVISAAARRLEDLTLRKAGLTETHREILKIELEMEAR